MVMNDFSRPGAVDLSGLVGQEQPVQGSLSASYVLNVSEADFEKVAAQSIQYPVIMEFHSPRDPQGAVMSESLARRINAAGGRFLLARVDVDEQKRIAAAMGITAVPTVVALLGGQLAPLFQGTKSDEEIGAVLDQVAAAAVANGITGRAEPVSAATENGAANPRFAAADRALAEGDYRSALAEFDRMLVETPNDLEVVAGRAQAALLVRSLSFDPARIVECSDEESLSAQLDAADLEVIQGHGDAALDRLLHYASKASDEEREAVRVRLLDLFEILGRTNPVVLKARRRLTTVLFRA